MTYLLTFLTIGIFWNGQQTQLNRFSATDRTLTWLHLLFLAVVALLPFSTSLLAEFISFRLAPLLYWADIFLLGALLYGAWTYALRAGLVREDSRAGVSDAIKPRILVAQALYAFGAVLCIVSRSWSIAFIVLVQVQFAIAPRVGILSRF